MNMPVRFESLLWMASPMMAWAQAGSEEERRSQTPEAKVVPLPVPQATRPRRKRKQAA